MDDPRARRWLPWLLATTASVVGAVAMVVGLVVVLDRTDPYAGATEAATAFGVQMNTYDASRPQEFLDRMEPFLDAGYRDGFVALVKPLLVDLRLAGQASDRARVDDVEVVAVGGDEARVQLDVSSRITQRGEAIPERLPQTWTVDLVERDGRWLVTAFAFGAPPGDPATET